MLITLYSLKGRFRKRFTNIWNREAFRKYGFTFQVVYNNFIIHFCAFFIAFVNPFSVLCKDFRVRNENT